MIPSIVRQLQYEIQLAFLGKIQNNEEFVAKWLEVTKDAAKHTQYLY